MVLVGPLLAGWPPVWLPGRGPCSVVEGLLPVTDPGNWPTSQASCSGVKGGQAWLTLPQAA